MREPVYRLPPDWRLQHVTTALSEVVDWSLTFLGVPPLWAQTRGTGIKVAVLDTGCDVGHPDLRGGILDAQDFSGSRWGVQDRVGHGTWCAGMIGARAENNTGVAGIAPGCQLLIAKVLDDQGVGSDAAVTAGLAWALERGADIISMSFGGPSGSPRQRALLRHIVGQRRWPFASAGNEGPGSPDNYPAAWPETISVAAVGQDGRITDFSSRSPTVDIAAPGADMLSTVPGGYARNSGTSMACPVVAGVAALCLAKHRALGGETPVETLEDFRAHLQETAIDQGRPGADDEYGFGLISPEGLLKRIAREPPAPPVPPGPIEDGKWVWIPGAKVA